MQGFDELKRPNKYPTQLKNQNDQYTIYRL